MSLYAHAGWQKGIILVLLALSLPILVSLKLEFAIRSCRLNFNYRYSRHSIYFACATIRTEWADILQSV